MKVIAHMSMSVDGYIAGPNQTPDNALGNHGSRLHDWFLKKPAHKHAAIENPKSKTGAVIIGQTMYHNSVPHWRSGGPVGTIPTFVLTSPEHVPGDAHEVFTFVTDGIQSALKQAMAVAGDKDIWIGGGAHTVQSYLKAGLLDELQLHVVPVLLGGGTSMFGELGQFIELNKLEVTDEPGVTHFTFKPKVSADENIAQNSREALH